MVKAVKASELRGRNNVELVDDLRKLKVNQDCLTIFRKNYNLLDLLKALVLQLLNYQKSK